METCSTCFQPPCVSHAPSGGQPFPKHLLCARHWAGVFTPTTPSQPLRNTEGNVSTQMQNGDALSCVTRASLFAGTRAHGCRVVQRIMPSGFRTISWDLSAFEDRTVGTHYLLVTSATTKASGAGLECVGNR